MLIASILSKACNLTAIRRQRQLRQPHGAAPRRAAAAGLAVAAALLSATPAPAKADDVLGLWRMANGKVTVRIGRCGGKLCGTVVGLLKPKDSQGRPKLDKHNPNPALRQRPVIGLTVMSDMTSAGDGSWTGRIYNADDGNTYASTLRLNGDTMVVKGCVAVLCRDLTFKRVN